MKKLIGLFLSLLGSSVLYSGSTFLLISKYGIKIGYIIGTTSLLLIYLGTYLLFRKK